MSVGSDVSELAEELDTAPSTSDYHCSPFASEGTPTPLHNSSLDASRGQGRGASEAASLPALPPVAPSLEAKDARAQPHQRSSSLNPQEPAVSSQDERDVEVTPKGSWLCGCFGVWMAQIDHACYLPL